MEGLKNYLKTIYYVSNSIVSKEQKEEWEKRGLASISFPLKNGKIFSINKETTKLLELTNNKIKLKRLPFPLIFIDCELDFDTHIVFGFSVSEVITENNQLIQSMNTKQNITSLLIHFMVFDKEKKVYGIESFELFDLGIHANLKKKVGLFLMNFLDLLNNPEIEIAVHKPSEERNQKRLSRGKSPIPERRFVIIKGKIKEYVDQLKTGKHFSFSHRFWVRGHMRHYTDVRYGNEVRSKTQWIMPYIKGKGLLIDKMRIVRI